MNLSETLSKDIQTLINNVILLDNKIKEYTNEQDINPEDNTRFLEYLNKETVITNITNSIESDITNLSFFFEKVGKLKDIFELSKNYYITLFKTNNLTEEEIEKMFSAQSDDLKDFTQEFAEEDDDEDVEISNEDILNGLDMTEDIENAINRRASGFNV